MSWLETSKKIRKGISSYAGQLSEKEAYSQDLEGLLLHLNSTLGIKATEKELKDVLYGVYTEPISFFLNSELEKHPLFAIARVVEFEDKSIERVDKLIEKSVLEMNAPEMEQAAIKMFTMPQDEYKKSAQGSGICLSKEFDKYHAEYDMDGILLLGALEKIHKIKLGREDLIDRISGIDFGLGYFENMLKLIFKDDAQNPFAKNEGVGRLRRTFERSYDEQKAYLNAHLEFDKSLTAQHKIPQPKLLTDKTINLDITPYAIAFSRNKLVVLGGKEDKEDDTNNLRLEIYDIGNGKQTASAKSGLMSAFSGAAGMVFSFQGSLSIGSNGIIYVGGGRGGIERFDANLNHVDDADNYQDAIAILREKDILCWNKEIFQVIEDNGVTYFAMQPSHEPKCYDNFLVATDGKKIIGEPFEYSPSAGHGGCVFDDTPRIVVDGNKLYFKQDHSIIAVDRSLTNDAFDAAFKMVDEAELSHDCIPSNHCLDASGLLWAVTQLPKEIVSSIKAYKKGKEKGEIVTHFYPENHPGGWPSLRSMAISQDGILAYSDVTDKKIQLYKLQYDKN